MISDEQRRIATRDIQSARQCVEALDREITRLTHKRSDYQTMIGGLELVRDGIEPCRACRRKVKSPCHDRPNMMEHGAWDSNCRSVLFPESAS